jgi:hypothetical protein
MTLRTIKSAAMKLPAAARGELAAALLSSLEMDNPAEIEQAWIKESERRYRQYRLGRTTARPASESIAAARKALHR